MKTSRIQNPVVPAGHPARVARALIAACVAFGLVPGAAFVLARTAQAQTTPATEANKAPPADKPRIKGDPAYGEYLSSLCVTCHLPSGKAVGGIPPIVAWPEDQFVAVVNSYRWKERDNEVMQTVTAQLSDEDIAALAAYFGGLTNQPDVKK